MLLPVLFRTSSWTSPHSSWMPYFSRSPAWRGVCVQLPKGYGPDCWSFETTPKNHCLMIWQAETLVDRYTHTHCCSNKKLVASNLTTGSLDVAILAFSAGSSNLTCRCSIVYQILSGQLWVLEMVVAHACHTRSIWLVLSCFVELMGNRTTILYHVSSQSSGHMLAMPLPFQTESSPWRLMVEVGGLLF